jgi:hypothetical protein
LTPPASPTVSPRPSTSHPESATSDTGTVTPSGKPVPPPKLKARVQKGDNLLKSASSPQFTIPTLPADPTPTPAPSPPLSPTSTSTLPPSSDPSVTPLARSQPSLGSHLFAVSFNFHPLQLLLASFVPFLLPPIPFPPFNGLPNTPREQQEQPPEDKASFVILQALPLLPLPCRRVPIWSPFSCKMNSFLPEE